MEKTKTKPKRTLLSDMAQPTALDADTRRHQPATRYVPLPDAPKSTSPVPWLTSIHGTPGRGDYGNANYRGNCSGLLIRDLCLYYQPRRVLDPMAGSGTCRDVCTELGIACTSLDLRAGTDASNANAFQELGKFDFVWLHPPYWKMVHWSNDPRCLANAPTLGDFLQRLRSVIRNCASVLEPGGVLAVLMGDYRDRGNYLALPFRTMNIAAVEGLEMAAPEIIRFSHGTTSARQSEYAFSFIPLLHDVCLVLRQKPKRA